MIYLKLFLEFFKIGLFSVGGGLATLPFLYDLGSKTGWFTAEDVANMLAVSESTPGPIGVNMATYVGYNCGGIPGGVAATLGLVAPSILVILLIAAVLEKYRKNRYVNGAFYGLRPASTGLIAAAGWPVAVLVLGNTALFASTGRILDLFRWGNILIFLGLWCLTNVVKKTKKLHPICFIILSAVLGIVFRLGGA